MESPSRPIVTIPFRTLLISVALFLGLFFALLIAWPAVESRYAGYFRNAGNMLVGMGSHGSVWFAEPPADPEHDTELVVVDPRNRVQRKTALSSYRHAYFPTAFLIAMTLATPVRWSSRMRSLTWGLLLIHLYIAGKFVLFPMAYGQDAGDAGLIAEAARSLLWVLSATTVGWALIPMLIWLFLTFIAPGGSARR